MNIFIAGGTGAIGRVLVPLLVSAGHQVVALTRSVDSVARLEQIGAVPVVGDVYDDVRLALAAIARIGHGILVEDKGYALAIHYRLAPDKEKAIFAAVGATVSELPAGTVEILRGKSVG